MLLLDHLVKIVCVTLFKLSVFDFFWKLLEEKMLELRRHEEKSSSHTDELSQVIKVREELKSMRIIQWLALHTYVSSLPRDSSETFQLTRQTSRLKSR